MKRIRPQISIYLVLIAVLAGFAGTVPGQSRRDERESKRLVEQANKAMGQRNFGQARDLYGKALALVPRNPEARYFKGAAHVYLDEYDQALTELNSAIDQGYKKPLDVYLLRWRVYYARNDQDAALADVQRALAIDPNNNDLQLALADIAFAKGQYRDALEAYRKAMPLVQNNGDVHYKIALIQQNLGDAEGQAAAAQEAINKGTRFVAESFLLQGDAFQKMRKPQEALEAYRKALSAKPEMYEMYRTIGELYRSQGRFADAIDVSRQGLNAVNVRMAALNNDPSASPEAVKQIRELAGNLYTDASWYYSLADRHEEAVDSALAGIRLLPEQSMAHTNLCRAYNDLNRPAQAMTACNQALKLNPNDGETLFYLGRASDLANRRADATAYYKRAVKGLEDFTSKNPGYSDGFYLLGNAYFADNQRSRAIAAYQKALDLSPRFAKARYNLGIIQVLEKNKPAATEQYKELMAIDQSLANKLKSEIDKM